MWYIKLAMVCCGLLFVGQNAVSAEDHVINPYPLPRDKSAIVPCRQAALKLRPGQIQDFQAQSTPEGFHYRFAILGQNGEIWVLICDSATQQIIKTQRLD